MSLNNLANRLSDLGRREEALSTATEPVVRVTGEGEDISLVEGSRGRHRQRANPCGSKLNSASAGIPAGAA
jgi:hypothetical protein